ncbi:MAG: M4 family metallopeptidase [Bacillota bacterium]
MKRFLVLVLVFVLAMCTIISAATEDTHMAGFKKDKKDSNIDKKAKIVEKLDEMQNKSEKKGKSLKVEWNKKKGNPSFIVGSLSDYAIKGENDAFLYLDQNKGVFALDNGNLKIKEAFQDEIGATHYRAYHEVDGIPVYGSEVILHTDAEGMVYAINGSVESEIPEINWSKEFKNNTKKVIDAAAEFAGLNKKFKGFAEAPTVEAFIYNKDGAWQPVYLVTLKFLSPYPANWKIFVNSSTNKVVDGFNALAESATTGSGVDTHGVTRNLNLDYTNGNYYMKDLTRGSGIYTYNMNYSSNEYGLPGTLVYDTDNNFNSSVQAAAVDAHYYAGIVYDYYKNNHGRNSYDGNGALIKSSVHFGSNYNNAFWWNGYLVYGDGDGTQFAPLSGALDVIAHEFTHAVTENSCNLEYRSQSGALNESMSDVFGYLAEGEANDWQMGEDITTPNIAGDALRDLQNPTLYNQPAHMNDYQVLPETEEGDWGGVHINSGIPNKAFYNIATTINDNTKVGRIYYRALTAYLTSTSQFTDARNALLQAAADLYGSGGAEYQAVANGFTAVGIGGTAGGGDTYEPNNSRTEAYGAIASGTVYDSYIYSSNDVDYYYFDISAAGNISVTLTNLPGDYDLYLLNSSGSTIAKSEKGSTSNESISYSASGTGRYYVKVIGYSGAYSTSTKYALKATYPTGGSSTYQWYYENVSIDTPHNYTNNYNNTYTYTKSGAQKVAVHFSRFETEKNYDFVYIKDKNGNTIATYDGTLSAFWATVDGDQINVNLVTDYSVTAYGYHIDQVAYYSDQPLTLDAQEATSPELLEPDAIK